MGNKVKYNLKNVHAAKLTETITDGVKSFSYGTPKAIPGAVSIALDAEGETSSEEASWIAPKDNGAEPYWSVTWLGDGVYSY